MNKLVLIVISGILSFLFSFNVKAEVIDSRFVKNQGFKDKIIAYVDKGKFRYLCNMCGINLSNANIHPDEMIFIVNPLDVGELIIYVPIFCNENEIPFGEIGFHVTLIDKESLNIQKILNILNNNTDILRFKINKRDIYYESLGLPNSIKYKNSSIFNFGDGIHQIYYSYDNRNSWHYEGIIRRKLEPKGQVEEHFYAFSGEDLEMIW
jgi:hypothetical protein